jgi:hypothetical protein
VLMRQALSDKMPQMSFMCISCHFVQKHAQIFLVLGWKGIGCS